MSKYLFPFCFMLLLTGCEIRPLDPVTGKAIIEETQASFDAETFVDENWDSQILPAIRDEAVDLATLLHELNADQEATSEKYGYREGSRPYNFRVKGSGQVVRVDTTSRAGVITIALPGNATAVSLQIGPVIRGTALRDALPFITFDQFVNQLEYAKVSNALHSRLLEAVLSDLKHESLLGGEIDFYGVFAFQDLGQIIITPVDLRVEELE